jgi:carbamoyltransferase
MNVILGVSAFYHDSAAVLLIDGRVCAAAQEERFTRKKNDASFPVNAIKYVFDEGGVTVSDLTSIVFYDKPFLKFERLLETYHAYAPKGLRSFLMSMPLWMKEKIFTRKLIWDGLSEIEEDKLIKKPPLLFSEHHLSHAASAFYPSPYNEAAILTIDGVGEWATTTISVGRGNRISVLREMHFPHSIGLLYSAFTYYCGFKVNSGEYKLMGLAPYGNANSERVEYYKKIIMEELVDLKADGSLLLNMEYFDYPAGFHMCKDKKWEQLFGVVKRLPESDFTQPYMDMALAIQQITEEVVLRLANTAKQLTGCQNLVMAGGVALNCVANGKLLSAKIFDGIWIQPAAGDAGGALGAAFCAHHIWGDASRKNKNNKDDLMNGSYLGPEFFDNDIARLSKKYKAVVKHYVDEKDLCNDVAKLISEGNAVGWFQGRMEYGPRALGNRSILADPRDPKAQKILNLKIKKREGFRPFAPSVRAEDVAEYFNLYEASPYMTLVEKVREDKCIQLPDDYEDLPMYERLYFVRSDIPAVTHVDYSARIQTVHKETNQRYWDLISHFKELTGCGVVLNTSFNVRGEPIVCTPEDAYECFMQTNMDWLVINNYIFQKKQQPDFFVSNEKESECELD